MIDTYTLLLVCAAVLQVLGLTLLLAWAVSRRARGVLAATAATSLIGAVALLPVGYYWQSGALRFAQINIVLLALVIIFPAGIVATLAFRLARMDRAGQGARPLHAVQENTRDDLARADMLEQALRAAMRRGGELHVVYQPIHRAEDCRIVGVEALLRWDHPTLGAISPAEFISIAEQSQLIVPLGAWVLETACMEAATWRYPIYVSVNLSPVQLARSNIVQGVGAVLARTGLPAHRLSLEVTETTMMSSGNDVMSRLSALRRTGIAIAIDDFGTGYSSLGYLREMPFDILKIDRAFVRPIEEDTDARAIIATVLELSRQLNRQVVAEGVETQAQLDILKGLGCERVQGWLLGKPLSAERLRQSHRLDGISPAPTQPVSPDARASAAAEPDRGRSGPQSVHPVA